MFLFLDGLECVDQFEPGPNKNTSKNIAWDYTQFVCF